MTVAQIQALPIHSDPEIMSGTPVFIGTRVPVRTVFDYLADGCTPDEFLDNFPSVTRQDAICVLEAGGNMSGRSRAHEMRVLIDECLPRHLQKVLT